MHVCLQVVPLVVKYAQSPILAPNVRVDMLLWPIAMAAELGFVMVSTSVR